ncbi:MAG: Nif3-like dinuclear metal center hexameric protein [Oscillospiraceae bacterium]|nr:Nif3-like dinuclear metal center hexameric protein [Oscillospiraceae bacterium]
MTTVNEILQDLTAWAPLSRKEDWDNVGLACGRGSREVETVLVALDPTLDVLFEAKERGAQLVVSHHPMTISGLKQVNDRDLTGMTMLWAMENQLTVVNLHTNLDCAVGGVNDCLAAALGLQEPELLPEPGKEFGYVRMGAVNKMPLLTFLPLVKERLGCAGLRYADGRRPVRRVAVGGGACASMLEAVLARGCDTFVTADAKYNHFLDAEALGLNLIDAGHFETESVVCPAIVRRLRADFCALTVLLSEKHHSPVRFL